MYNALHLSHVFLVLVPPTKIEQHDVQQWLAMLLFIVALLMRVLGLST
jgi:hypothetical protein